MAKDREQELRRLERELLEEEQKEKEEQIYEQLLSEDDPLPEEDLAEEIRRVLEGRAPIEAEVQNMDRTDVDLDDYSREVLEPKKRRGCGCTLLVILLLVGAIGAVVYFLLPYLGRLTWINGL